MTRFFALIIFLAVVAGLVMLSQTGKQPAGQQPGLLDTPRPSGFDLILGDLSARETARVANDQAAQAEQNALAYQAAQTSEAESWYYSQTAAAALSTQAAGGTATEQAWSLLQLTVTADMARATVEAQHTATADVFTATAIAGDIQSTQIARDHYAGVLRRAAQREELQNQALAKGPIFLTIIATAAILVVGGVGLVKYWKRPQVIKRNAWGDAPLLWDNHDDLIDADRLPAGLVRVLKNLVQAPMLADPEVQERTTARDQTVDLTTRGIPGQPSAPRTALRPAAQPAAMLPAGPTINFRVLPPGETPAELVDPEKMAVLEGDWREVK